MTPRPDAPGRARVRNVRHAPFANENALDAAAPGRGDERLEPREAPHGNAQAREHVELRGEDLAARARAHDRAARKCLPLVGLERVGLRRAGEAAPHRGEKLLRHLAPVVGDLDEGLERARGRRVVRGRDARPDGDSGLREARGRVKGVPEQVDERELRLERVAEDGERPRGIRRDAKGRARAAPRREFGEGPSSDVVEVRGDAARRAVPCVLAHAADDRRGAADVALHGLEPAVKAEHGFAQGLLGQARGLVELDPHASGAREKRAERHVHFMREDRGDLSDRGLALKRLDPRGLLARVALRREPLLGLGAKLSRAPPHEGLRPDAVEKEREDEDHARDDRRAPFLPDAREAPFAQERPSPDPQGLGQGVGLRGVRRDGPELSPGVRRLCKDHRHRLVDEARAAATERPG